MVKRLLMNLFFLFSIKRNQAVCRAHWREGSQRDTTDSKRVCQGKKEKRRIDAISPNETVFSTWQRSRGERTKVRRFGAKVRYR